MMRSKLRRLGLITPLVLLAVAACSSSSGGSTAGGSGSGSGGAESIGFISTFSGPNSVFGQAQLQGMEVAVGEANAAGGVLGKKISIVTRDDQYQTSLAVQGLHTLASSGVHLIVGPSNTDECLAMVPLLQSLNSVMLGGECSTVDLKLVNPRYFRVNETNVESNAATASFVCGLGGVSRLDALTLNYTSAAQIVSLLTQSVKGCGINLGSNILIPPTATDMLPYVTSLVNKRSSSSHADSVLLLDIFGSALVNALKQGNALQMSTGYRASIDSATAWFQSAEALAPNVPPTYAITQYYYTAFQNSSNQEFVRDFQKKYHTVPNNENYQGYANALAMIAAIKKAHSFDAASVAKAFAGLTFSDPQGTTTVDPSTHVAPSSFTVVLYEGSSSKLIKIIRPSNG